MYNWDEKIDTIFPITSCGAARSYRGVRCSWEDVFQVYMGILGGLWDLWKISCSWEDVFLIFSLVYKTRLAGLHLLMFYRC